MDNCKICHGPCGMELPLTAMHWDRDNSAADGFKNICKMCRSDKARQEENKDIAERVDKLDQATSSILDTILSGEQTSVPHLAEVFETLLQAFGGPQGFSKHFMANYLMAKPGSPIRQKQLDTIIRLSIKATETGAAKKPLDMMDDKELEDLAREQIRRLSVYNPKDEADDKKVC